MVDCGETPEQQDVILLSAMDVIGSMLSRLIHIPYGHKVFHPSMQLFVIAPPASGKGCISWVRRLAEPRHKEMMGRWKAAMADYRKMKCRYDMAGKMRTEMEIPEEPRMKMFIITGNNSSTGIQENLMDAEGQALICEVEADTVSASINADYGGWSDMLRKAFDHGSLAYNRRANHEYREIDTIRLSLLISGTPAQVKPLIPSAENGLYSRQIFYMMPPVEEWIDQFSEQATDYDNRFRRWGEEWKKLQDTLEQEVSCITFRLTDGQREAFNQTFAQLFTHAIGTHQGHHAKSSVIRLAINILRMMSVVAQLRGMEQDGGSPLLVPASDIPDENIQDRICPRYDLLIRDDDFRALLSMAEPLYRHAMEVLWLLPSEEAKRRQPAPIEQLLEGLPMHFSRKEMVERAAAMGINERTVDTAINRLVAAGKLNRIDRGHFSFSHHVVTPDAKEA